MKIVWHLTITKIVAATTIEIIGSLNANAEHHPRVTLQIAGVKTDRTVEFLQQLQQSAVWQV